MIKAGIRGWGRWLMVHWLIVGFQIVQTAPSLQTAAILLLLLVIAVWWLGNNRGGGIGGRAARESFHGDGCPTAGRGTRLDTRAIPALIPTRICAFPMMMMRLPR